jgi:hypothetical protein
MPITLPNSGLVCPEAGDPSAQACDQIKALFAYVDNLPTDTDIQENPCVSLVSINWLIQGDPAFKNFKQTVTVPDNVNPFKSAMRVVSETGEVVNLCIEIDSFSTVCVYTNTVGNYQLIFG